MTVWVAVIAAILLAGLLGWLVWVECRWRRYCRQQTATLHRLGLDLDRDMSPDSTRPTRRVTYPPGKVT